ncbi:unnamed protein product, partial [Chrysoparadoxa australica]
MPSFMIKLLELLTGESHCKVKLFVLQLLLNDPGHLSASGTSSIFSPWAPKWLPAVLEFALSALYTGGFSWFLHDVCSMVMRWQQHLTELTEEAVNTAGAFISRLLAEVHNNENNDARRKRNIHALACTFTLLKKHVPKGLSLPLDVSCLVELLETDE